MDKFCSTRKLITVAALLATFGVPWPLAVSRLGGFVPPPPLTWTKQAPAASPAARDHAPMTYDAATGTLVLFGGRGRTTTRNRAPGSGTAQPGPSRPPRPAPLPRAAASMAYDAATGNVVLFGGINGAKKFGDTWIWDGLNLDQADPSDQPLPPS